MHSFALLGIIGSMMVHLRITLQQRNINKTRSRKKFICKLAEMAEVESIIQQASLFFSEVGLEAHPFKVGKSVSLDITKFINYIEVFNNAETCARRSQIAWSRTGISVYCNLILICLWIFKRNKPKQQFIAIMRLMRSPLSFYGERGGENWEVSCKQHCKCLWWK